MPRPVRVTWIDAFCPEDVWYDKESFTYSARTMVTVGWCILQDADYLAIAATYDEDAESYCGVILIPRGCIRRIGDVQELVGPSDGDSPATAGPIVAPVVELHGTEESRDRLDRVPRPGIIGG